MPLKPLADKIIETDLLIIGGGLAGTSAALKAREVGVNRVTLVEKAMVARSGPSTFAAGVITAWFPEDDLTEWIRETVEHGQYMNDQEWVEILYTEGYHRLKELEKWGVEFERDKDGRLARSLGRGQLPDKSLRNIMFHGPQFMAIMRKQVLKNDVQVIERVMVTDLLTQDNRVVGAVGFNPRTGDFYLFKSRAVILAAGANLFKTIGMGHKNITGDSYGMAYRAGVALTCFEFCTQQSCAKKCDIAGLNMFVGTGARLINARGERFMERYYPVYKEREIIPNVAGAMAMEVRCGRGPIYLDMTHFSEEQVSRIRRVLPLIMKVLDRAGLDIRKEKIEWVVRGGASAVATGGAGIVIDKNCETNLTGLYAIGDAACTVYYNGAGDSGAQNLLWCLVSGVRAAQAASKYIPTVEKIKVDEKEIMAGKESIYLPTKRTQGTSPDEVLLKLQEVLFPYDVTIIRHKARLEQALKKVEKIGNEELSRIWAPDGHEQVKAHELTNMVRCAELVLRSAMFRTETRGANFREDYPYQDNCNWLKWVEIKQEKGEMALTAVPIPIEKYPFKPREEKIIHPIFSQKAEHSD